MTLIELVDRDGRLVEPEWLARAEAVHRQLRPQIPAPYIESMGEIFAGGGRMLVAVVQGVVAGVAVYRVIRNTASGCKLYVDDLVVDAGQRSTDIGRAVLTHLEDTARQCGCAVLELDSGTQRERAHRFYFRAGYTIRTFGFTKNL